MFFNKYIKYRDILYIVLIALVGYKLIDNYQVFSGMLSKFLGIMSPFIYALVFAYCLNPVMNFFEKRLKLKRGLSILVTYLLICGTIVMTIIYVAPSIIDSIISITSDIPRYSEIVQGWINHALQNEDIYGVMKETGLLEHVTAMSTKFGGILVSLLEGSLSSIFSFTANMVKVLFGFLISIYVLADKETFIKESKFLTYMIFKEEKGNKIIDGLRIYHRMIGLYVGTKALDSLIIGILALIGLLIMKAPYAILIALVVGVTNMIPYFGPLVGEVVGAAIGIFVSPAMAIGIAVFLLILQQFDAWYLEAKLVGSKVGVKPFFIVLGVIVGGGIFGPVGMLLSSPTVAALNVFYDRKVGVLKVKNKSLISRIEENGTNWTKRTNEDNETKKTNEDNWDKETNEDKGTNEESL